MYNKYKIMSETNKPDLPDKYSDIGQSVGISIVIVFLIFVIFNALHKNIR